VNGKNWGVGSTQREDQVKVVGKSAKTTKQSGSKKRTSNGEWQSGGGLKP